MMHLQSLQKQNSKSTPNLLDKKSKNIQPHFTSISKSGTAQLPPEFQVNRKPTRFRNAVLLQGSSSEANLQPTSLPRKPNSVKILNESDPRISDENTRFRPLNFRTDMKVINHTDRKNKPHEQVAHPLSTHKRIDFQHEWRQSEFDLCKPQFFTRRGQDCRPTSNSLSTELMLTLNPNSHRNFASLGRNNSANQVLVAQTIQKSKRPRPNLQLKPLHSKKVPVGLTEPESNSFAYHLPVDTDITLTQHDDFLIPEGDELLKHFHSTQKKAYDVEVEAHRPNQDQDLSIPVPLHQVTYKRHKKIFNPKIKSYYTNRDLETQESNYRVSRGKKRTVIKCMQTERKTETPREYQKPTDDKESKDIDSMSTVCQSNETNDIDFTKYKLKDEEINSILKSCENDKTKMMSLCKELLRNGGSELKSLLSKHTNDNQCKKETVTDSIKRKAKEMEYSKWKVDQKDKLIKETDGGNRVLDESNSLMKSNLDTNNLFGISTNQDEINYYKTARFNGSLI